MEKPEAYVGSIISESSWNTLVGLCGHKDLIERIREDLSDEIALRTKEEVDNYLKEKVHETILKYNLHRTHITQFQKKNEEESRKGRLCAVCHKKMHIMTSKVKLKDDQHVCGDCWEKAGFNSWGDILKKPQIYTSDDIRKMIYK